MYEFMQLNFIAGSGLNEPEVVDNRPEVVKNEAFSNQCLSLIPGFASKWTDFALLCKGFKLQETLLMDYRLDSDS